jgi:hypothetical protein
VRELVSKSFNDVMGFQSWHTNVNQDDVRVLLCHEGSVGAGLEAEYSGKPGQHAFARRVGTLLLHSDNF